MRDIETAAGRALPWPAPWPGPKRASSIAGAVFFAAAVVGGVTVGISLFLPGPIDPRAFVIVALIPAASGLSLGFVVRLRIRSRSTRAVRCDDETLTVPFRMSFMISLWLVTTGTLLIFVLFIAISWLAAFASSPPNALALIVGLVLLLLALPFAGLIIEGIRGKAIRGELSLSAEGILYRTVSYDARMDWAAVQTVSVEGGATMRIVVTGYNNLVPTVEGRSWLQKPAKAVRARAAQAAFIIQGASLSVDPALALHTLRYYFLNPAARAELGTEAAVQRMRAGAVLSA